MESKWHILLANLLAIIACANAEAACSGVPNLLSDVKYVFIGKAPTSDGLATIFNTNSKDGRASFLLNKGEGFILQIDLGQEFSVDYIMIKEQDNDVGNISIGSRSAERAQPYVCGQDKPDKAYMCKPDCGAPSTIGRFIYWTLENQMNSKWFMFYSFCVSARKVIKSDDLAYQRPYRPSDCNLRPWAVFNSSEKQALLGSQPFSVDLGNSYRIESLLLIVGGESLDVQLSGLGWNKTFNIAVSTCESLTEPKGAVSCTNSEWNQLPVDFIKISTRSLTMLNVKGTPYYYPDIVSEKKVKDDRILLTCGQKKCSPKLYSKCDMKTGIELTCRNIQLLRIEKDQHWIIASDGVIEPKWRTETSFKVEAGPENNLVVSVPKTFEYFGDYRCSCMVNDFNNKELTTSVFKLTEAEVGLDIAFRKKYYYKRGDMGDAFNPIVNNLIEIRQANLVAGDYLNMKIEFYTLSNDVKTKATFYESNKLEAFEYFTYEETKITAFPKISDSWKISAYLSTSNDPQFYPDLIKTQSVLINWINPKTKQTASDVINVVVYKTIKAPDAVGWLWKRSMKMIEFRAYSPSKYEQTIALDAQGCNNIRNIATVKLSKSSCSSTNGVVKCLNTTYGSMAIIKFVPQLNDNYTLRNELLPPKILAVAERLPPNKMGQILNDLTLDIETLSITTGLNGIDTLLLNVTVKTKLVLDYVPCGSVNMKVQAEDGKLQQVILSGESFELPVAPTTVKYALNFTVELESIGLQATKTVELTNPRLWEVKDLKVDALYKKLSLNWTEVPVEMWKVLSSYEYNVTATSRACPKIMTTYPGNIVKKAGDYDPNYVYNVTILDILPKQIMDYEITVQPIFTLFPDGDVYGVKKSMAISTGKQQQTTVKTSNQAHTRSHTITVNPGQDIACDYNNANISVELEIKGLPLNLNITRSAAMKNQFEVAGLWPGRKYYVAATVMYDAAPHDIRSERKSFITYDEIFVPMKEAVADFGSKFTVPCRGARGIKNSQHLFKTLMWGVDNGTPQGQVLPHRSRCDNRIDNDPDLSKLIFDKISTIHEKTYICFIDPSMDTPPVKFKLFVNAVVVEPSSAVSVISNSSSAVCYSKLANDTFSWRRPDKTPVVDDEDLSVTEEKTPDGFRQLRLTVNNVRLAVTGEYMCGKEKKGFGFMGKTFLLQLVESAQVKELPGSSKFVTRNQKWRCSGTLAHVGQKAKWIIPAMAANYSTVTRVSDEIEDLTITNAFVINGLMFNCSILPATPDGKKTGTASMWGVIARGVEIVSPPAAVQIGIEARIKCLGFFTNNKQSVEWIYLDEMNKTVAGPADEYGYDNTTVPPPWYRSEREGKNEAILVIPNAQVKHEGKYRCRLTEDGKEKEFNFMELKVKDLESKAGKTKDTKPGGAAPGLSTPLGAHLVVATLLTLLVARL